MSYSEPPAKRPSACVVIIGGGPSGLMAAEVLSHAGCAVELYDAMPSVGRKFLLAGRGGLNLTHSEPIEHFTGRYRMPEPVAQQWVSAFGPDALRRWTQGLGIETFIGSSGRVFPVGMKASPLLRAWLKRMAEQGVGFHLRHRWRGWNERGELDFDTPEGRISLKADATLLALGGGSWARLGSDGAWTDLLNRRGIAVSPLQAANCGFDVNWSETLRSRYAGEPVKSVNITLTQEDGSTHQRLGEFVISRDGVEGSLIYALSALLREQISANGFATITIDLAPARSMEEVATLLSRPRGKTSLANHLRRSVGITGVKAALLRECGDTPIPTNPIQLAERIKKLPLTLIAPRPIDEAISSAGGVRFDAVDGALMLKQIPGVFCAGEMLDWEAPTGGYLLTGCFASGSIAARGMLAYLANLGIPLVREQSLPELGPS